MGESQIVSMSLPLSLRWIMVRCEEEHGEWREERVKMTKKTFWDLRK